MEKLPRPGGRLLPFGRSRNRSQVFQDEGGEQSGELSSDEDNGPRTLQRPLRPSFRKTAAATTTDRYLNVEGGNAAQVRFQPRRQSARQQTYQLKRGAEIPASGPMRILPNGLTIVEKRPMRKVKGGNGGKIPLQTFGGGSEERAAAQLAEKQQQATTNYCRVMEILVK